MNTEFKPAIEIMPEGKYVATESIKNIMRTIRLMKKSEEPSVKCFAAGMETAMELAGLEEEK